MTIVEITATTVPTTAQLRRALRCGDVVAHHQPVVDLLDGRLIGTEALVRWHDGGGVVPADRVIALAESGGLLVELGAVMLDQACAAVSDLCKRRLGERLPNVAVNVAAEQLRDPGFEVTVLAALDRHGVAPERLVLEVTETSLVEDLDACAVVLGRLRRAGIRVAADDFGSGYCSLTYLQRLPVDILKIDRLFVERLRGPEPSQRDRAVVATIIDLAHAFGLETIAEGIESPDQLEELRALGCDHGQGYLWTPALPIEDLMSWAAARAQLDCEAPHDADASECSVLVVDDDQPARDLVAATFACERSHRVVAAVGDGRRAVALARHHQPDLVVLDLAMPGLGGLVMLPLLRAVAPRARIVVHSGLDDPAAERQAQRLGADAYLVKGPDSAMRLATVARSALAG